MSRSRIATPKIYMSKIAACSISLIVITNTSNLTEVISVKKISILLVLLLCFLSACKEKAAVQKKDTANAQLSHCIFLLEKKKIDDGIQCLEILKAKYPGSEAAQDAELAIGDAYFRQKDYAMSIEAYETFLKIYPTHPKTGYANYKLGLAYLKDTPKAIDRDQSNLPKAIQHLSISINRYPDSEYRNIAKKYLKDALSNAAKKEYYVGNFYYRTGQYIAAIPRFQTIVDEYSEFTSADLPLYRIVVANIKLQKYEAAKEAFSKMAMKYPNSKLTKKAEGRLLSKMTKRSKTKSNTPLPMNTGWN